MSSDAIEADDQMVRLLQADRRKNRALLRTHQRTKKRDVCPMCHGSWDPSRNPLERASNALADVEGALKDYRVTHDDGITTYVRAHSVAHAMTEAIRQNRAPAVAVEQAEEQR